LVIHFVSFLPAYKADWRAVVLDYAWLTFIDPAHNLI